MPLVAAGPLLFWMAAPSTCFLGAAGDIHGKPGLSMTAMPASLLHSSGRSARRVSISSRSGSGLRQRGSGATSALMRTAELRVEGGRASRRKHVGVHTSNNDTALALDFARLVVLEVQGSRDLVINSLSWVAAWTCLFYALAASYQRWSLLVAPSSKEHENNAYWCARNAIGVLHSILISALSVPAFVAIAGASQEVKFGHSDHVVECKLAGEVGSHIQFGYWAVAKAGMAFTTFTMSDLVVSIVHYSSLRFTLVDFFHHAVFITAGVIIRRHCMVPFIAAILLSMETSTPFLSYAMFFRHRGDDYRDSVGAAGFTFFALFIIFRIIINGYGTVVFWHHTINGDAMPSTVERWEECVLLFAVTAGFVVQLVWLPAIWKTARNFIAGSSTEGVWGGRSSGSTGSTVDTAIDPDSCAPDDIVGSDVDTRDLPHSDPVTLAGTGEAAASGAESEK